jgi:hypothetical protein
MPVGAAVSENKLLLDELVHPPDAYLSRRVANRLQGFLYRERAWARRCSEDVKGLQIRNARRVHDELCGNASLSSLRGRPYR